MRTITIDLPDHADLDSRQTAKFLAAKLYEAGKLSLGQAAGMVGMSKVAFAEILVDYGVSLINKHFVIADTSCFILLDKIDDLFRFSIDIIARDVKCLQRIITR
jgi:Uncharacterised protein family (UPF0175)